MFLQYLPQVDDLYAKVAAVSAHNVIVVELKAVAPVGPPHVGCAQLEYVQFERLLHKDYVVLCHAKAVKVAWVQC